MDKRRFLILVAMLALVTILLSQSSRFDFIPFNKKMSYQEKMQLWKGRNPESFKLTSLDGASINLADYIGKKVIILNFFATWCVPCTRELPELNRFYEENQDSGIIMLGINPGEDPQKVRRYTEKHKVIFPIVIDVSGSIIRDYEINAYPTTIYIGLDGVIDLYYVGQIADAKQLFGTLSKSL